MKRAQIYRFVLLASLAGILWLAWSSTTESAGTSVCLFRIATHLPCPSCGTTRAVLLLLHGEFRAAAWTNPLGIVALVLLVVLPVWVLWDVISGRGSFYTAYRRMERVLTDRHWVSASAVAVLAINWLWNVWKGI